MVFYRKNAPQEIMHFTATGFFLEHIDSIKENFYSSVATVAKAAMLNKYRKYTAVWGVERFCQSTDSIELEILL